MAGAQGTAGRKNPREGKRGAVMRPNIDGDLRAMIGKGERILYSGKPDKKSFVFESVFHPFFPYVALWGGFFFFVIVMGLYTNGTMPYFVLFIFFLFLMPVWAYLGWLLAIVPRYKNRNYVITDKAVYRADGVFAKRFTMKPFAELSHVDLRRSVFDQWFDVGDVVLTSAHASPNPNGNATDAEIIIEDTADYFKVFHLVKRLQEDLYADAMYPNQLRPAENHGYRTEYVQQEP